MSTKPPPNRAQRRAAAKSAKNRNGRTHSPKHRAGTPTYLNSPSLLLAFGQPECTAAEVAEIMLPKRMAFERIRQGTPTEAGDTSDSDEMAQLANLLVLLSERVTDAAARQHIEHTGHQAQDAVLRAMARHQQHSKFALDGQGLNDLAHALDVYEQMLPLIKPAHIAQALADMLKRAAQGHIYNPCNP